MEESREATVRILGQRDEDGVICRGVFVKFYREPEAPDYSNPDFGHEYSISIPADVHAQARDDFRAQTMTVCFKQILGKMPTAEQIPEMIREQMSRFMRPCRRGLLS